MRTLLAEAPFPYHDWFISLSLRNIHPKNSVESDIISVKCVLGYFQMLDSGKELYPSGYFVLV